MVIFGDPAHPHVFERPIRRVAIVGAGPSGLAAARHLRDKGIHVRIFERNARPGGVWLYSSKTGAQPDDIGQPGPVYSSLMNNIALPLCQLKDFPWPAGTRWNEHHHVLQKYLGDYASHFGLTEAGGVLSLNTRVDLLERTATGWVAHVTDSRSSHNESFDAVVVAAGHHSVPHLPASCPDPPDPQLIRHSKDYRTPDEFDDEVVMLVGAGTSGLDIHRDLHGHARKIYHSAREVSSTNEDFLRLRTTQMNAIEAVGPTSCRVGEIHAIQVADGVIEVVRLKDGSELRDIQRIIFCTGYKHSFPFLPQHYRQPGEASAAGAPADVPAEVLAGAAADDAAIVTDGRWTQNFHEDIFYRHDPTLAFLGIATGIATFTFFEFQSIAVAQVFASLAHVPTPERMHLLYWDRVRSKGPGLRLHTLGARAEVQYVQDLVDWLNSELPEGHANIQGHAPWFAPTRKASADSILSHIAKGGPWPERSVDDVVWPDEGYDNNDGSVGGSI